MKDEDLETGGTCDPFFHPHQVTDSGHPPLSSICVVNVNVTEESKYPPSVVPLDVFITTSGGLFANRVIGRLHASDQDLQDVLTYKLVSEKLGRGRFSVDPSDGKIWADENLEVGSYSLNVSVSDGRFAVWAGVGVQVWAPDQRTLDGGLTLRLVGLSPEEFLGDHWRGVQRTLGQTLGLARQEIHLASVQRLPDAKGLEALLVWRPQNGRAEPLPTSRIAGDRPSLTEPGVSLQNISGASYPNSLTQLKRPRPVLTTKNHFLAKNVRAHQFMTSRYIFNVLVKIPPY